MPKFNRNFPTGRSHGDFRLKSPGPASANHVSPQASIPVQTEGRSRQQIRAGSSFAARFGRVILNHGIAAIPSALYHYQGTLDLSAQQVWFVSYILSHKWDEDLPYPSLNKMARCGGVDKTQLYNYKDRLSAKGYLQVYSRHDERGKRESNAYDFSPLFSRLETLIAGDLAQPNAIRGEGDTTEEFEIEMADSSFVARYGRVIARYGVIAVPWALFTHGAALGLTLQQAWFITYILSYKWDTPLPFPSIKRMSAYTGYSTVQLHTIKNELVRAGYLRLVNRYTESGGQDSNAYDFSGLMDAITTLLQEPSETAKESPKSVAQSAVEARSPRRGRRAITDPQSSKRSGGTQLSGVGGTEFTRSGGNHFIEVDGTELAQVSGKQLIGDGGKDLTGDGGKGFVALVNTLPSTMVVHNSHGMVVSNLHKIESIKV